MQIAHPPLAVASLKVQHVRHIQVTKAAIQLANKLAGIVVMSIHGLVITTLRQFSSVHVATSLNVLHATTIQQELAKIGNPVIDMSIQILQTKSTRACPEHSPTFNSSQLK
jgi:hypothetical protein